MRSRRDLDQDAVTSAHADVTAARLTASPRVRMLRSMTNHHRPTVPSVAVTLLLLATLAPRSASAEDAAQEPPPEELEQRVRVLERKEEIAKEQAAEKAKTAPAVSVGKEGFALKSADGAFSLRIRGYVHADGRFFSGDESKPVSDTFILRRARPIVEATLWKIFDARLMTDFGEGKAVIQDGYLEARFHESAKLRAGKFKAPVGLERLQSATDITFVERALPTNLVPNRDLGIQLSGDLAAGKLSYAAGVFNGVVDGGSGDADVNDGKDVAARIFWRPLKPADGEARVDVGLGIGASSGDQEGSASSTSLPSYKTAGQQTFFSYRSDGEEEGTVVAAGAHRRISPQAWLFAGPFGVIAEHVTSSQEVALAGVSDTLTHASWEVTASWVATGEPLTFKGVVPRKSFDPQAGGFGAVILSIRASALDVDDDSFPVFADRDKSAESATGIGAGVSWNLTKGVRFMLDYEQTRFDGLERETEKVLFTRFQVAF